MILPAFLFITHCSHTACLVCQRALFLMLLSQTFSCTAWLVCPRAQPPPMFPFMPHSLSPYALYPDDSHTIVTHPFMLPLHYWPPFFPICDCHVTLGLVYISKAHSLYSLVLISQDFLFSCLNLCELAVGNVRADCLATNTEYCDRCTHAATQATNVARIKTEGTKGLL
jgi:hypothetical protein